MQINFFTGLTQYRDRLLGEHGGGIMTHAVAIIIQQVQFIIDIGIAQLDGSEKPVQLCFRQWVGAIEVDGVLGRDHRE